MTTERKKYRYIFISFVEVVWMFKQRTRIGLMRVKHILGCRGAKMSLALDEPNRLLFTQN